MQYGILRRTRETSTTSATTIPTVVAETLKPSAVAEPSMPPVGAVIRKPTAVAAAPRPHVVAAPTAAIETPSPAAVAATPRPVMITAPTVVAETPRPTAVAEAPSSSVIAQTPKSTVVAQPPRPSAATESLRPTIVADVPRPTADAARPRPTAVADTPKQFVSAFGPESLFMASLLPRELPLILCDGNNAAAAIAEAAKRRKQAETFLVAPFISDETCILSRAAGLNIYNQIKDQQQRLALFESLAEGSMHFNGKPIFANQIYSAETFAQLAEFAQAGSGLFARSQVERIRLERLLHTNNSYVAVAPIINRHLPKTRPQRDAKHIVIWAPEEEAMNLAIYAFALSQIKKPAIFVCKGKIPDIPHHFVGADRAEDAIANATVIVDTLISDPGNAIAFAGRGCGVISSVTTGAQEYVHGLISYKMHDFSSIADAMMRAVKDRGPRALPIIEPALAIRSALDAAAARNKSVSV